MKKKRKFSIAKKPVSKRNKLSLILSVVSALIFAACIVVSAIFMGEGGSYVGAIGLAGALFALYACILGIKDLAAHDRSYRKSYVGAILGGVIFIIWLTVFFKGVKL